MYIVPSLIRTALLEEHVSISPLSNGGGSDNGSNFRCDSNSLPPPTGVRVHDVTFSGADLINIVADPGTPTYASPPHWVDSDLNGIIDVPADRALPVGYPRNTNSVVSAHFTANISTTPYPGSNFSYKVRGSNILSAYQPYHYSIPETAVTLTGTDVYLPPTTVYNPFPGTVNYGALTINWEFSSNGGISWMSAGQTANELYVTLATPADTSPVYHTLLYISIPISAAVAAATEATVISQTFKKFESLTITDKHIQAAFTGRPLHYYKEWTTTVESSAALLLGRDGGCFAWAYLFADSLRAAGAIPPMQVAEFRPVNFFGEGDFRHRERLLVNNWFFNPDLQGGGTDMYQIVNASRYPAIPNQFVAKNAEGVWQYVWGPNEAAQRLWGDPGQNVANPQSLIFNHSLIKIGNVYYDPSYGKKFTSRQEWEDHAVAGFIVLDNQGKRFLSRQNPTGPEIPADTEEKLTNYTGRPLLNGQ